MSTCPQIISCSPAINAKLYYENQIDNTNEAALSKLLYNMFNLFDTGSDYQMKFS